MPCRQEGVRSLWKGNFATIVHRLPYSASNFWMYETVNGLWKENMPSDGMYGLGDIVRRLVSGGIAGMSACALVSRGEGTTNCVGWAAPERPDPVHTMAIFLAALGAALESTALHVVAGGAVLVTRGLQRREKQASDASAPKASLDLHSSFSCVGHHCMQAYPLDLVRTRLAAQTTHRYYHGITHALMTIIHDEGPLGMYRGLGATLIQVRGS
jgi:hypothetical protein